MILEHAQKLAKCGFRVFPLSGKTPAVAEFPEVASKSEEKIKSFFWDPVFEREHEYLNVGIDCGKYGDEWLLVVDVDNKGEKKGSDELFKLELSGRELPKTFTQKTPTGGYHYVYRTEAPARNRVGIFPGIDIRGRGGFIVGAGSRVEAGEYTTDWGEIARAPEWLVQAVGQAPENVTQTATAATEIDQERALGRAIVWLENGAPVAVEGQGGDRVTFDVCCKVKDFGLDRAAALGALLDHWNERCEPPWSPEELEQKVLNAWRYGQDNVGAIAPEAVFDDVEVEEPALSPFEKLNENYAFVIAGGGSHILWETEDEDGRARLEHISVNTFHQKFASHTMQVGNRARPVTELWMKSAIRRSYDGIVFAPEQEVNPRFYNLWSGFSFEEWDGKETLPPACHQAMKDFLDHTLENICQNDPKLFTWLMGYCAHLIQRPWEKPQTALVFRGGKGTGKNAFIDRIGALIHNHYLLTAKGRYLTGNFNSHLENLLLMVFDEATWGGDKQAEGILKDLVTGKKHIIEHKGKEPYQVKNCLRVVIIGNERWLVPASQDERRFAVFDIGEGRKQDTEFFTKMREGMEAGGYRILLKYLKDYDLSKVNVDKAPRTQGLLDQKLESLEPVFDWWYNSLAEGELRGLAFSSGEWVSRLSKSQAIEAYQNYTKKRNIRSWSINEQVFTRQLKKICPALSIERVRQGADRHREIVFPTLEIARTQWERFIGHKIAWEK